jgi:2'-5' RNA ligase
MHLTVKFLGDNVSEFSYEYILNKLKEKRSQLKKVKIESGRVRFGFPHQNRPNILFLDILRNEELDRLISLVHETIKEIGLEDTIKIKDRKKFTHHITLGRTKQTPPKSLVKKTKKILEEIRVEKVEFVANEIYFVQSNLTPTGPEYTKLESVKLS